MEYYEEDEGISLGQVFKVIFRRWKLLLIVTLVILIIGVLGTQLIYNKSKLNYSTTVEYVNVTKSDQETYINDSKFNYRDIIKIDNLNKVKSSDDSFSSIDVVKIVENEHVSITKNTKEGTNTTSYTVSVKGSYFKNSEQAKKFLYAVMSSPVNELISLVENSNNKIYLNAYKDSSDYETKVSFLLSEIELLDKKYSELNNLFPESFVDNKSVSDYQIALETKYGIISGSSSYSEIENLKNELSSKNYVKDFDKNKDTLLNKKTSINKTITSNEAIIEALEDKIIKYNGSIVIDNNKSSEALQPFTSEIARLTEQNRIMQNEIDIIDEKIANQGGTQAEIEAFEKKLNSLYNDLVKSADEYTDVSTSLIEEYSKIEYTGKAIESEGGLGLIISAVLFLVAGFVVAAIVNLILDRKYLKNDEVNNKPLESNKEESKEEKE